MPTLPPPCPPRTLPVDARGGGDPLQLQESHLARLLRGEPRRALLRAAAGRGLRGWDTGREGYGVCAHTTRVCRLLGSGLKAPGCLQDGSARPKSSNSPRSPAAPLHPRTRNVPSPTAPSPRGLRRDKTVLCLLVGLSLCPIMGHFCSALCDRRQPGTVGSQWCCCSPELAARAVQNGAKNSKFMLWKKATRCCQRLEHLTLLQQLGLCPPVPPCWRLDIATQTNNVNPALTRCCTAASRKKKIPIWPPALPARGSSNASPSVPAAQVLGWAQIWAPIWARRSPLLCRNASRFSVRLSSLSSTNFRMFASSTCARGAGGQQLPCGSFGLEGLGLAAGGTGGRPPGTGQYLGLVVEFVPVPRVPAAHGAVVQQQHGHLQRGRASGGELGGTPHVWGWPPSRSAPPGHSSPFQTPTPGTWQQGTRSGTLGTPWARRYLGQLQLFSLQELLCRHQVLRGRFVLAELCNTKRDPRSHRAPCHRVDTPGWVFPPSSSAPRPPSGWLRAFAAPPAHLGTTPRCCGMGHGTSPPSEASPSWIWPTKPSHTGFWAALQSCCCGRGHPEPWQNRGGGCRAPRRRFLLCRKLRMKAARSGRGCSRTDCPSSLLWLQKESAGGVSELFGEAEQKLLCSGASLLERAHPEPPGCMSPTDLCPLPWSPRRI